MEEDQQFCLRWNNFQANITSQFEALRDDEDFTDVTIACEGQRLQAHKVVLSACSPFFKELFKTNPCSHPIIFMRDVEARHVAALMEFMYAGEVNVAQAHLSAFLKTAESLKIRGLTDNPEQTEYKENDGGTFYSNPKLLSSKQLISSPKKQKISVLKQQISSTTTVTSSQDIPTTDRVTPPPFKRQCKTDRTEVDIQRLKQLNVIDEDMISENQFVSQTENKNSLDPVVDSLQPKLELPDYLSDDQEDSNYFIRNNTKDLSDATEAASQPSNTNRDVNDFTIASLKANRKKVNNWIRCDLESEEKLKDSFQNFRDHQWKTDDRNKLIKLGEGIEIYEDQLRSLKWSDYRKLTRGLAALLFSPAELATCSVTGQRWSRAGSNERPVKPALDRTKVQAIISYVATRFPMIEISRIKQVLAYKCKENSTALKMKAVRLYGDTIQEESRNMNVR